jgi:hypothetical protein
MFAEQLHTGSAQQGAHLLSWLPETSDAFVCFLHGFFGHLLQQGAQQAAASAVAADTHPYRVFKVIPQLFKLKRTEHCCLQLVAGGTWPAHLGLLSKDLCLLPSLLRHG